MNTLKEKEQNTWQAWATGKLAPFAIGFAAGYCVYKFGLVQKITGKLFTKKDQPHEQA